MMAGGQRNHAVIPQEILFDVLLWLPTKSLAQFKCVCKEWKSIISNSFFIKKHTNNVNKNLTLGNNHRLILSNSRYLHSITVEYDQSKVTVKQLKFPGINHVDCLKGVASCNGILCILFWDGEILLCNPCNREYKNLQPTHPAYYKNKFSSTNAFGFGYDHSTDDYKVVRLYSVKKVGESKRNRCEVYSLRTNSWKKIYLPNWNLDSLDFETAITGTLVNSTLYWSVMLDDCDDGILGFDFVKDQFVLLSLSVKISGEISALGNFEGKLCMFRRCYIQMCADIWAVNIEISDQDGMKSNHRPTHLVTVPYPEERTSQSEFVWVCSMMNGGQVFLINSGEESLHLLNIEEKAFKKLNIGCCPYATQAIAYTETLVSLNGNGGKKRFLNKKKSRKLNKRRKKNKKYVTKLKHSTRQSKTCC